MTCVLQNLILGKLCEPLEYVGGVSMDRQERKQDSRKGTPRKETEEIQADPEVVETGKKLQEEIDNLVDEIDEVLEENAAEFVKNYVQKGGQ